MTERNWTIRAVVQNKERERTKWVVFEFEPDKFPAGLEAALVRAGWVLDEDQAPEVELDGVVERVYVSEGTGLFNGWTPAEARSKMKKLRAVLREFGISEWSKTLTIADLL